MPNWLQAAGEISDLMVERHYLPPLAASEVNRLADCLYGLEMKIDLSHAHAKVPSQTKLVTELGKIENALTRLSKISDRARQLIERRGGLPPDHEFSIGEWLSATTDVLATVTPIRQSIASEGYIKEWEEAGIRDGFISDTITKTNLAGKYLPGFFYSFYPEIPFATKVLGELQGPGYTFVSKVLILYEKEAIGFETIKKYRTRADPKRGHARSN